MRTFTAAEMQRASSEIQRAAAKAPVLFTFHDKPRFVMMSIEDYVRTNRGRVVAGPETFPDSVMARIRELEDAHPEMAPQFVGGLLDGHEEEEPAGGPHP